jgi:hypothetical protein
MFTHGHEPEQPGVLVRDGMDRDDVGTIDIDPAQDLAECLLAQLVRYGRFPPQGAELQRPVATALR